MVLVQKELSNAYIGIPNPESITLDKSSISLTTVGRTEQLTATIEPTISDHSITWSSNDTSVATVSTTGLVTCVTPGTATITATTVNGLTASCSVSEGWSPGVNTVAYYPLTSSSTVNDLSGNSHTLTSDGNVTFGTYNGVDCCYINVGMLSGAVTTTSKSSITENIWYCEAAAPQNDNGTIISMDYANPRSSGHCNGVIRSNGRPNGKVGITGYVDEGNNASTTSYSPVNTNTWYNVCYTYDGSTLTLYVNGQLVGTASRTWSTDFSYVSISRSRDLNRSIRGYVSNAIYENRIWTSQEISDYYDQTKSLYGIS